MTHPPARPPARELQAFIDGELPPDRHQAVLAAIAGDPALAAEFAQLSAERASFDQLAERLLLEPVPQRLLQAASRPPVDARAQAASGKGWGRLRRAVPVTATLAMVVAAMLLIRHPSEPRRVAGEPMMTAALEARDGVSKPLREVTFQNADASGVGPGDAARFVSEALGQTARAPDLRRAGFVLVTGQLYGGRAGRAIQLRYLDRGRRLFTVYIHPGAGPDRFRLLSVHHLRICLWENQDVATVMSGALPQPELFRLASMAYVGLSL